MTTYTLSIIVEGQDRASGPLGGVGGALGRIGEIAGGILTAGAIQQLGQAIIDFGKKAINATAQMQQFEMGLQTLLTRELRTADASLSMSDAFSKAAPLAQTMVDKLRDLAIQSPYELGTVQDTFRLAMAFGYASEEAESFTKGILNMAAGVGANNDMLGRMAYNFAQIRMQGKVTAMDVRQLAMAGFDLNSALKDIGSQFGLTIKDYDDFNTAISQGKIKWEDFAGAFEKYADDNFGGASQRMSRTLSGLQSTFSDFFLLTMPTILGPATEQITTFLQGVLDGFLQFSESGSLEEWGASLGTWVSGGIEKLEYIMQVLERVKIFGLNALTPIAIGNILGVDPGMIQGLMDSIAPITDGIASLFTPGMMSDWGESLTPIMDAIMGAFLDLGPIIASVMPGIMEGISNVFLFIRENGPGLISIVSGFFGSMIEFGTTLIANVLPFLVEKFNVFSEWLVANGPLMQEYFGMMGEAVGVLLEVIASMWVFIEPLFSGLFDIVLNLSTLWMQVFTGDMPGALETLQTVALVIWETIKTTLINFLNWIAAFFGSSLSEIGAVWSQNWDMFLSIMSTITNQMLSAVLQMGADIVANVTDMLNRIKTSITNAAGLLYTAGQDMVNGLKKGIANKIEEILNYIRNSATRIRDEFAKIMGIKSPSKVFEGFGVNIMDGLAIGLQNTSRPVSAINQAAQAVMSPFASAASTGSSISTTNSPITIIVNGAGDPEQVADAIYKRLRLQGVAA